MSLGYGAVYLCYSVSSLASRKSPIACTLVNEISLCHLSQSFIVVILYGRGLSESYFWFISCGRAARIVVGNAVRSIEQVRCSTTRY